MRLARWTTLCLVPFLMASLPARAADWALRFDGIGPLQIGMRFDAANAALNGSLRSTPVALRPTPRCEQVPVAGHPGVALMFVDEVLERVDVFQAGVGRRRGAGGRSHRRRACRLSRPGGGSQCLRRTRALSHRGRAGVAPSAGAAL